MLFPILAKNISEEIREKDRWLIWRYIQRPGKSKPDKVPHTAMGYPADVTNPEHWSRFDFVLKVAARPGFCDGIGYAFHKPDEITGLDIDSAWMSDGDEGADWALRILERFRDTYSEVSPSGRGMKVWCRARAPRCGRWPIEGGAVEVYDERRFFVVTSRSTGITALSGHQQDVERLVANLDRRAGRTRDHGSRPVSAISSRIPAGQRHPMLVSLAGTLWRRGLAAEEIEIALMAVNRHRCDPPHSEEHIRKLVGSIARWQR